MEILAWIVFGQIGGLIGYLLFPGRIPGSYHAAVLVGIAGAAAAGMLAELMDWGVVSSFGARSFLLACTGSVLTLALVSVAARGRSSAWLAGKPYVATAGPRQRTPSAPR